MIKLIEIPVPEVINKKTKALAVLDAIFCQEWELRYFSHNSKWSDISEMGSMRDGEGDDYFILFINFGAAIKGSCRESYETGTNRLANMDHKLIPKIYVDFINEPAFSIEEATFIIWFDVVDRKWKKIGYSNNDDYLGGGADSLLRWICGGPEVYKNWAEKYFEKIINIELVRSVFEFKPIDMNFVKTIIFDIDLDKLQEDLEEIGYPYIGYSE